MDKVTLLDQVKGTVEHLFEYVTGSLTDVTFDVFAAEDIKAADGVSEDYFKAFGANFHNQNSHFA